MNVQTQQNSLALSPGLIIQLIFVVLIVPFLPLIISGKWNWWEAWLYGFVFALGFIVSRALANKRHPDLLAERANAMQKEDAKSWDRILAPLLAVGSILIAIVAGIEARGGATSYELLTRIAALVVLLLGYTLSSYAMIENRFFSGLVRIQADRNHHVVSTGPYRWVRHPGYAGMLLIYLATPVLLESRWALIPTSFFILVLILRTHLEDNTLQDELNGYRAYTQHVTARLVPGLW